MNRAEHLSWCKERALEYVNRGDTKNSIASFMSDMNKHPDTKDHAALPIMGMMLMTGQLNSIAELRRFIEGFN